MYCILYHILDHLFVGLSQGVLENGYVRHCRSSVYLQIVQSETGSLCGLLPQNRKKSSSASDSLQQLSPLLSLPQLPLTICWEAE